MIRVNLGNRTLGITFQREVKEPSKDNPRHVRSTWCEIHRLTPPVIDENGVVLDPGGKTEAIVARSYAQCAKRDVHRHELGRKLALARALKQYLLPKEDRARVWAAYLDRARTPRAAASVRVKVQPIADGQQADGFKESNQSILGMDLNAGEQH